MATSADFGSGRTANRLRKLTNDESLADEEYLAWTRAWVSRDGRWNVMFAARHRDFVVLTSRRLLLCQCGFFTRRPVRKVFDVPRGRIYAEAIEPESRRRLRVTGFQRKPLRIEFGTNDASAQIADALLASSPPPPPESEPEAPPAPSEPAGDEPAPRPQNPEHEQEEDG
jgi:hypothetical protein